MTRATSLTEIGRLIDWDRLPRTAAPIARLLVDGYAQSEIARELGVSEDHVGAQLRELRKAMVAMALERPDELTGGLRLQLEEMRDGRTRLSRPRAG
jgi:DNA-binding CsgD family transcriptional regulator